MNLQERRDTRRGLSYLSLSHPPLLLATAPWHVESREASIELPLSAGRGQGMTLL